MKWPSRVIEFFFSTEAISQFLPFMCKTHTDIPKYQNVDIISQIILIYLTSPIHLIIDTHGIYLFMFEINILIPFQYMTQSQRDTIKELCTFVTEYNIINSKIVFKKPTPVVMAPIQNVLQAMCNVIYQSKKYSDPKVRCAICNIILQRIQGYIPISNQTQKELNKWMKNILKQTT